MIKVQERILADSTQRFFSIVSKSKAGFANDDEEKYVLAEVTKRVVLEAVVAEIRKMLETESVKYNQLPLLIADHKLPSPFWSNRISNDTLAQFFSSQYARIQNLVPDTAARQIFNEFDFLEKLNLFERFTSESVQSNF